MYSWTVEGGVPWATFRSQIQSIKVSSGVTNVGALAFYNCNNLENVTLPENLRSIDYCSFAFCGSLTGLTVPEGVEVIEAYAFVGCSTLTAISIPTTLKSVGIYAFNDCNSLVVINYQGTQKSWNQISIDSGNSPLTRATLHASLDYTCGANMGWYFDGSSGTLVINGSGAMYDWSTDTEVPWYSLRSQIRNVNVGSGVTSIGNFAFYACNSLSGVTLPKSLRTIGYDAFAFSGNLMSITIPAGVTTISPYAFCGCGALTAVAIPKSVTSIGTCAFYYCVNLKEVYYGGQRSDWNRIRIESNNEPLTNATLNTALNYSCGANVSWSFNAKTGTLTISGSGPMDNWAADTDVPWYTIREQIQTVVLKPGVTSIGDYAFYYCYAITSITIPDGVTSIGGAAFYGCGSLASVTLPASVDYIGFCTFAFCIALRSIEIPAGVENIFNYAFYSCSSMTSVTIPKSVRSILSCAFHGCGSLTTVNYAGTRVEWNSITIEDYNDPLKQAKAAADANQCGENVSWSFNAGSGTLTISGSGDMYNWAGETDVPWYSVREQIRTVSIGSGVTSVGDYAFYYCYALTKITLPSGLKSIGGAAFYGCGSLASITLPKSVNYIGYCTFAFCIALKSVNIPAGVTNIYPYAFYSCSSMTGVTIPKSVTNIWVSAFYACGSLNTVTYAGSQAGWNAMVIEAYNEPLTMATLTCKSGSEGPGQNAAERTESRFGLAA